MNYGDVSLMIDNAPSQPTNLSRERENRKFKGVFSNQT